MMNSRTKVGSPKRWCMATWHAGHGIGIRFSSEVSTLGLGDLYKKPFVIVKLILQVSLSDKARLSVYETPATANFSLNLQGSYSD